MGIKGEKHTVHCSMCDKRKPREGGQFLGGYGGMFVCSCCLPRLQRETRAFQVRLIRDTCVHGTPERDLAAEEESRRNRAAGNFITTEAYLEELRGRTDTRT